MPVQAKNGLAALLLADDMQTSGVKQDSKDDTDKTDFGAALSGLVAAMVAPAPSTTPAVAKNQASIAVEDAPEVTNDSNSHRAAATPANSLTSKEISNPALAAFFDSLPTDAVVQPSASRTAAGSPSTSPTAWTACAPEQANGTPSTAFAPLAGDANASTFDPSLPAVTPVTNAVYAQLNNVVAAKPEAPVAQVSVRVQQLESNESVQAGTTQSAESLFDEHAAAPAAPDPDTPIMTSGQPQSPHTTAVNDTPVATKPTDATSASSASSAMPNGTGANQPQTAQSVAPLTNAVVAPSAPIAARAANAYRDASATIAPNRTQVTVTRHDNQVNETTAAAPQVTTSGATAVSKVTEAAPIRPVLESVTTVQTTRVANVKVDLADGQTAQAMVRERAGSVDVKIVAPGADSARHITGEVDALRSSLEGAGLTLAHSEVSYQSGSGQNGREPFENNQGSSRQPAQSNETFTLTEENA